MSTPADDITLMSFPSEDLTNDREGRVEINSTTASSSRKEVMVTLFGEDMINDDEGENDTTNTGCASSSVVDDLMPLTGEDPTNDVETETNTSTTTSLANSSVVDAMMSSSGEDLTNNEKGESSTTTTTTTTTTSGLANSSVDAPMSLNSSNNNNEDGTESNTITEVANNNPAVALEEVQVAFDDGEDGSGSGNNEAAVVKKCVGRSNRTTSWSCVVDQGMRNHMEDNITTIKNYMSMRCNEFGGCTSPNCTYATESSPVHYFAVFDGHCGAQVSAYCARTLHEIITEEWRGETGVDEWGPKWQIALSRAYERIDDACQDGLLASAGSTAVVVLLSSCQIIAANCGDSRAVLVRKRETVQLTNDHKPGRIDEAERIDREGGLILNADGVSRVAGVLAMTRAIGDHSLKPWISSVPEITFTTRSEKDECLIIASDGVWDVMTTNEVGAFARGLMRQKRRAAISGAPSSFSIANLILEKARSRRSTDNISVIAVDMKPLRKRRSVTHKDS